MTGYTAGMLNERITIHIPGQYIDGEYGRTQLAGSSIERWASVTWSKGVKALHEGAVDAYDTIMVRLRYDQQITRDCKLEHDGTMYRIQSFHADRRAATIQITAVEILPS